MELHTIGVDLGKTACRLVGLNLIGKVVVRKKFSRLLAAVPRAKCLNLNATGGQGFRLILINAEQVKKVHHPKCLDCKGRRVYQLRVSAELFRLLERIYHGSNPGRVDHWHCLKIQDEKRMVACECSPDSLVKLIESLPHPERAFHADGTGISALQYVEVHDLFLPSRKIALHLDH
jgi:hypothetical protein